MKYIRFWFDIGYYTGADELYMAYPEGTSEVFIENDGEAYFYEHCEDYSHLLMAGVDEDLPDDMYYQEWLEAVDNCSWGYEEVSEEEYYDNADE